MKEDSTGTENTSTDSSTLDTVGINGDDDIVFVAEIEAKNIGIKKEPEADQDEAEAERKVNKPIEEIFLSSESEDEVQVVAVLPPKKRKVPCNLPQSLQNQESIQPYEVKYLIVIVIGLV